MAPALSQTAEAPTLAEVTGHSRPPTEINGIGLLGKSPPVADSILVIGKDKLGLINSANCELREVTYLSEPNLLNGGSPRPGLAPPLGVWAEDHSFKSLSALNMDDTVSGQTDQSQSKTEINLSNPLTLESSECSGNIDSESMGSQGAMIGLHSNTVLSTDNHDKTSVMQSIPRSIPMNTDSSSINSQNELLALMTRDVNGVNEIIETLQKLASNPDLLSDLEVSQSSVESVIPSQTDDRLKNTQSRSPTSHLIYLLERQKQMERRRLFLLRRLHRLSARGTAGSISKKLDAVVRQSRLIATEEKQKDLERLEHDKDEDSDIMSPLQFEGFNTDAMKGMSASDLVSLVCKVESSQMITRNQAYMKKLKVLKSTPCHKFPEHYCTTLGEGAQELRGAIYPHIYNHDSDATESSSGGESCDEGDGFPKHHSTAVSRPIFERALSQYCRLRGWVASRWLWLQAQLADLDTKIAQQQKINMDTQALKSAMQVLPDEPSNFTTHLPTRDPAFSPISDPALTCTPLPSYNRQALNGFHSVCPKSVDERCKTMSDTYYGCSRTLGTKKIRRRKYVKLNSTFIQKRTKNNVILKSGEKVPSTVGLCKIKEFVNIEQTAFCISKGRESVVSTRYSDKVTSTSSNCGCIKPLSCILCIDFRECSSSEKSGNPYSHSFPALVKMGRTSAEKLAQVDSSFHPVLSKPSNLNRSLHLHTLLNNHREKISKHSPIKNIRTHSANSEVVGVATPANFMQNNFFDNNSTSLFDEDDLEPLASFRSRSMAKKRRGNRDRSYSRSNRHSLPGKDEISHELASHLTSSSVPGSNASSPCPSPASFTGIHNNLDTKNTAMRKINNSTLHSHKINRSTNTNSDSYDIDNIVIPYSMASSTKVEVLQYKDIPTPKWRYVDEIPNTMDDSDSDEDITEPIIVARHLRSEEEERRKFVKYANTTGHSRQSRARRIDSSGTNTPDQPLSPRPLYEIGDDSADSPTSAYGEVDMPKDPGTRGSTVLTLSLPSIKQDEMSKPDIPYTRHRASLLEESSTSSNSHADSALKTGVGGEGSSNLPASLSPKFNVKQFAGFGPNSMDWVGGRGSPASELQGRVSPFYPRSFPLADCEYQELCSYNDVPAVLRYTTSEDHTQPLYVQSKIIPSVGTDVQNVDNYKPRVFNNEVEDTLLSDELNKKRSETSSNTNVCAESNERKVFTTAIVSPLQGFEGSVKLSKIDKLEGNPSDERRGLVKTPPKFSGIDPNLCPSSGILSKQSRNLIKSSTNAFDLSATPLDHQTKRREDSIRHSVSEFKENRMDFAEDCGQVDKSITTIRLPLIPGSLNDDSLNIPEDSEMSGRSTPLSELTASATSADEIEWSDDGKSDKHPPEFNIRALKDREGSILVQVTKRSKGTHTV